MKTLRDLRRFILAKSAEGNHAEVRAYLVDNLDAVARAFHVSAETIISAVESERDDAALVCKLLETLRRTEALVRKCQRENRRRSAQASADALSTVVQWKGERAHVDLPSLFASALTRRDDLLVFTCEAFTVAVHMAPLLDLARIHRVRDDLSGWVDAQGLHLRWGRGGGLNLRPQEDPDAVRVILHLPPCKATVIAA
jgi:hypothetical protein